MTLIRALIVCCLSLALMAQAKPADLLSEARAHYNEGRYDDAIRVASEARKHPELEAAALVISARAHLEKYRQLSQSADMEAARQAMKAVDVESLDERQRVELLLALGTALYIDETHGFDHRFSAAAEQFELAFAYVDLLDAAERDQLFDWWAGSLDRQAQQGSEPARRPIYQRILARAEAELEARPSSTAAAYWLAAATRGVGDLTRAIGAAVAGWVRAESLGRRGEALQIDLDRLMRQVLLPERAAEMVPDGDPRPTLALLESQWVAVKERWGDEPVEDALPQTPVSRPGLSSGPAGSGGTSPDQNQQENPEAEEDAEDSEPLSSAGAP